MYLRPAKLQEAVEALASRPLTILAGGTDHYPARVGHPAGEDILDLVRVAGLRGIRRAARGWRIGATTTWTDVIEARLPPLFDGLRQAAREVGGVQIQNAGTIAGNLCNASPAADGVPALLALDASVILVSRKDEREIPLSQFVVGARRTRLEPHELVREIRVPAPRYRASASFLKLGARKYLLISIAMAAIVLEHERRTVRAARIAVGSCSSVATRLPALEEALVGRKLNASLDDAVRAAHFEGLQPIDDVRASAEYRLEAARTLVTRGLAQIGARA